jgi:hypothetical protein
MKKLITILLGITVAVFAGCSDQPTTPQPPSEAVPQAQSVPADLQRTLSRYTITDDGIAIDPALAAVNSSFSPAATDTGYDVYAVTFLWGSLLNVPQPPSVTTDWSGRMWANAVAIVDVRYTIDFERGEDSLVPVDVPSAAAWVSYTTGDLDGISTLVFLKRGIEYFAQPMLTFETAPFTISFPFERLENLTAYFPVDNMNGVAVMARKIHYNPCPAGLIRGEWIKGDIAGRRGTFGGIWVDRCGNPVGVMSGRFWTNEDGLGEFSGTLSGIQLTVVIAELNGIWRYDDPRMCPICGAGHGFFRGTFRYLTENTSGEMMGEFGDLSLPPDQLRMPLIGVWRRHCPFMDVAPDNVHR